MASLDDGEFETLEVIGRGSEGVIRKVRRKRDGHIFCRKEVAYTSMTIYDREKLRSELRILASLRHPNIVSYLFAEDRSDIKELHLYMEYCDGGDLLQVIKKLQSRPHQFVPEDFVWRVFAQLIVALYRCHNGVDPPEPGNDIFKPSVAKTPDEKGRIILHRDLKPANVFLDDKNQVKLGDFGFSRFLNQEELASTFCGTPYYMSPEICSGRDYTFHSDIWSLGCTIYELCAKTPPFNATSHRSLVERIQRARFPPLPRIYSAELRTLVASCLAVDDRDRPDTGKLLNAPEIKLARRQMALAAFERTLKQRERELESEKAAMMYERIDLAQKVEAEVERRVQVGLEELRLRFDAEVQEQTAHALKSKAFREQAEADFKNVQDDALDAQLSSFARLSINAAAKQPDAVRKKLGSLSLSVEAGGGGGGKENSDDRYRYRCREAGAVPLGEGEDDEDDFANNEQPESMDQSH